MAAISHLRSLYHKLYVAVSGSGVRVKPWHFQYTATFYLHRTLRRLLPCYGGDILDVGCGDKPYQDWFGHIRTYIGLDIYPGEKVDVVVQPTERWPFPDSSFDVVICTQVLEHVEALQHTLNEITRVLRPSGVLIASFPFIYNEHGEPNDFRRFSAYGARQLFSEWDIQLVERQGGIGTTLAVLLLNWIDTQLSLSDKVRWLKGMLLPLWLPFCLLCNGIALLVDRLDLTGKFYSNVLVVCLKK